MFDTALSSRRITFLRVLHSFCLQALVIWSWMITLQNIFMSVICLNSVNLQGTVSFSRVTTCPVVRVSKAAPMGHLIRRQDHGLVL